MDTEACPVSRMTSTAAGRSSSVSSEGAGASAEAPPPFLSFSWTDSSIFRMTSSEYWASPVDLTKRTTRSISSGVMKQPWTRMGLPLPRGA